MNSAELYMRTRVALDTLSNTMLAGVTPESVTAINKVLTEANALNAVIGSELSDRIERDLLQEQARASKRASAVPLPSWDSIDTTSDDPSTLTTKVRAELIAGSGHMRHDHIF